MRFRISWRSAVLTGLALALTASLTVSQPGHLRAKPRASAVTTITAASVLPVASISATTPLQVGRFFEAGYTMAYLGQAMTQLSAAMGLQWGPVQGETLPIEFASGKVTPISLTATVSVQGPPYVELVHADPAVYPWNATATSSPSHVGYAVHNLAAASDALVAAGFPRIATVAVPGQDAAIFAYHRGPGGMIIELIDAAFAPPGVCDVTGSVFCGTS
jgi:Glyoxalase/Bleomycin resistance protein/Dioxygenase superfamily